MKYHHDPNSLESLLARQAALDCFDAGVVLLLALAGLCLIGLAAYALEVIR